MVDFRGFTVISRRAAQHWELGPRGTGNWGNWEELGTGNWELGELGTGEPGTGNSGGMGTWEARDWELGRGWNVPRSGSWLLKFLLGCVVGHCPHREGRERADGYGRPKSDSRI